jgi:hypothetical protein
MSAKTTRQQKATPPQEWRKSSHSNGDSACVEVAPAPDGGVSIRHSRKPHGAVLTFTAREWRAFLDGARNGEFDCIP